MCIDKIKALRGSATVTLIVVFIALFVDYTLTTIIVPIIPIYLEELNVTESKIGILFASKAMAQLAVQPAIGPLSDAFGRTVPMFAGFVILVGSTVMFALGTTYWQLILARSIQGIGSACTATAGMAILADIHTDETARGAAMGKALGGLALGVLVGPPLGGVLYHFGGKLLPFMFVAGLGVFDGILQLIFLRPSCGRQRRMPRVVAVVQSTNRCAAAADDSCSVASESIGGDSQYAGMCDSTTDADSIGKLPSGSVLGRRGTIKYMRDLSSSAEDNFGVADGDGANVHVGDQHSNDGSGKEYDSNERGALLDGAGMASSHEVLDDGESCEEIETRGAERTSFFTLIRDPYILIAVGGVVVSGSTVALLEPALAPHINDVMGIGPLYAGLIFASATMSYAVLNPFVGGLGHRFGRWFVGMVGLLVLAASFPLIALPRTWPLLLPPLIGVGMGMSLVDSTLMPLLATIVDVRHKDAYGSVYAICDMGSALGFVIGPTVGTTLVEHIGFAWALRCLAFVSAGYAPLLFFLRSLSHERQLDARIDAIADGKEDEIKPLLG